MRCKNCGCRAVAGKYCTGCGMMQPRRVSSWLKRAVATLGVLAVLLTAAICYVLIKIEPTRRVKLVPQQNLSELLGAAQTEDGQNGADKTKSQPALEAAAAPAAETPQQDTAAAAESESAADAAEAKAAVDNEVKKIRSEFDEIEKNCQNGGYARVTLQKSVYVYADGAQPRCLVLRSGANGTDFDRKYYFTQGKLRFAYYEAADANRMYFKDDELLRLRYAEDTYNSTTYTDYDGADSSLGSEEYNKWWNFALDEAYSFYDAAVTALALRAQYILPDSDCKYLSEQDLAGLSAEQLRLARNEIFARHGRRFDDPALQEYFDGCDWYEGTVDAGRFSERVFNEYERANVELIRDYETAMGYR